jgi:hypothetical protein
VTDIDSIVWRYRQFADREAHGSSPSYESWARLICGDPALLSCLATLPPAKRQPNLVFAALRWHGAVAGNEADLRAAMSGPWDQVADTIMQRSTQTNEPARWAVLLPLLHRIDGPIALVELGAAAGLCLIPDRYSYRYSDGTVIAAATGPSPLTIDCRIAGGSLPANLTVPEIAWRRGIDLNPLDPADPDTAAWLTTLIWPEHEHRRERLSAALNLAADAATPIRRGDIREQLAAVITEAPSDATTVVLHSATLSYLSTDDRAEVLRTIADSGARHLSFEGRDIVPLTYQPGHPVAVHTAFVAALDRVPGALADGHGDTLTVL